MAERYGQNIHQLNMRLSVALLRNREAEQAAREKAEAPTVKTKEQSEREARLREKYGTTPKESHPVKIVPLSPWRRKFRPLPENKAIALFADVVGDAFLLLVAGGLIIYEYWKALQKPDANLERIREVHSRIDEMKEKEAELEECNNEQKKKIKALEETLLALKASTSEKTLTAS